MNLTIGMEVKIRRQGYDFGSKPVIINGLILGFTAERVIVSFQLMSGRTIIRNLSSNQIVGIKDDQTRNTQTD